ncbi:DUF2783 domain-containing protein [Rhizobium halophilum]|uniref:DUF2783 domain-containing protein n=1 Tax=Rhizobium halophilum TaxID=2846852 RepID=UPI00293E9AD1|nr:DUF2783 domain-containing protein [Rhizobium halophilum]
MHGKQGQLCSATSRRSAPVAARLHDGLSDEESLRLWARLTLIPMNRIGKRDVLLAAIDKARKG